MIGQRSYDLRRTYDTTYSQNVSQAVIVSFGIANLIGGGALLEYTF